jgi:hypothetical protein
LTTHKQEALEKIFEQLRCGEIPEPQIVELLGRMVPADTIWMMKYIESLAGPQDYMDDLDEHDDFDNAKGEVTVKGFFQFIDLVSLLILKLGDDAIAEAKRFENSSSHYAPYILRYCTDPRFAKGIREDFPFLEN